MKLTTRAQNVLDGILKAFEQGTVPQALAQSLLPPLDVPSAYWSINNRMLMAFAGTIDARGIQQWRKVGRWPKKGSKAFYILVPMHVQKVETDALTGQEKRHQILVGFSCCPVFRVEDTDGQPLDYPDMKPTEPPPLVNVAEAWGLKVDYLPFNGTSRGFYSPDNGRIGLSTHHAQIFFHELAHAAHHRALGTIFIGQNWRQEVVAELTAVTLAHLYGHQPDDGGAYRYIGEYAEQAGKNVYQACLSVIADVGKCLELILAEAGEVEVAAD